MTLETFIKICYSYDTCDSQMPVCCVRMYSTICMCMGVGRKISLGQCMYQSRYCLEKGPCPASTY